MLSYLLVCLALVSSFVGVLAAPPGCQPKDMVCNTFTFTTKHEGTVVFSFDYDPTQGADNQGTICSVRALVISNSAGYSNQQKASPEQVTGTVTTFVAPDGSTRVVSVQVSGIPLAKGSAAINGNVGTTGGATITVTGDSTFSDVLDVATGNRCNPGGGVGDPHFTGFHGQRFCLKGAFDQTFNILSSAALEINSRMVELKNGDSMGRTEMRMARMQSLFTLPSTQWFDHPGPYMSELGVAMINGHRLYAAAGSYLSGFASVQLDDVNVTVSDSPAVLGSGDEEVRVTRQSSHKLFIDTPLLQLTITNSDYFYNIELAYLKPGFDFSLTPLGGVLGQTADKKWKTQNKDAAWKANLEAEALVESNDLFELNSPVGGARSS